MTYEYEKLSPGERQYDDYDLTETTCVPARYVKAVCSTDSGNPFIEALPFPRDFEEVSAAYTKPLTDFDYERIKAMSPIEQQISVTSLRSLRYMLPFHPTLEVEFHTALLNSYRNRHFRYFNDEQQIVQNDEKQGTHLSLQGKAAAAANAGCYSFGLFGVRQVFSIGNTVVQLSTSNRAPERKISSIYANRLSCGGMSGKFQFFRLV